MHLHGTGRLREHAILQLDLDSYALAVHSYVTGVGTKDTAVHTANCLVKLSRQDLEKLGGAIDTLLARPG